MPGWAFPFGRAGALGDLTRAAGEGGTSDLGLSFGEFGNADRIRELTAAIR